MVQSHYKLLVQTQHQASEDRPTCIPGR